MGIEPSTPTVAASPLPFVRHGENVQDTTAPFRFHTSPSLNIPTWKEWERGHPYIPWAVFSFSSARKARKQSDGGEQSVWVSPDFGAPVWQL